MRGDRRERSVQSILGNEYVAQAGASAEQGDVQRYRCSVQDMSKCMCAQLIAQVGHKLGHMFISKIFPSVATLSVIACTLLVYMREQGSFTLVHSKV